MLESKKDNYYGFDVMMYKVSDHLWISNVMPNEQHLVNQLTVLNDVETGNIYNR